MTVRIIGKLPLWQSRKRACAAGAQEGAALPPLVNHPRQGSDRLPATASKFFHMLWKNLRCDNVASVAFYAGAGRRGRPAVTVRRLSGFAQRFFRMPLRCCTRFRQDAPAYPGVRGKTVCAELPPLRPLVFLSQRSRYEVGAQSAPCSQEEEGRSIRGEKRDRFAPLMRPPRAAARFSALPKRASAVETARLAAQATFPSL